MNQQASALDRLSVAPLMTNEHFFPLQALSSSLPPRKTHTSPRERISLDQGWRSCFEHHQANGRPQLRNVASITGHHLSPLEDDASSDQSAQAPHQSLPWLPPASAGNDFGTLNLADLADGGCYRRTLVIDPRDAGRRFTLELNGHLRSAAVWVNGRSLGRARDLTPYLVGTAPNTLEVQTPASTRSAPRQAPSAWLVKTDALHVAPLGTCISASLLRNHQISLAIGTMLQNGHFQGKRGELVSKVLDAAGNRIGEVTTGFHIFGDDRRSCDQTITIESSALASPGLHRVVTSILVGDRVIDESETNFDLPSVLAGSLPRCSLLTGR